jgi:hypothetical protein
MHSGKAFTSRFPASCVIPRVVAEQAKSALFTASLSGGTPTALNETEVAKNRTARDIIANKLVLAILVSPKQAEGERAPFSRGTVPVILIASKLEGETGLPAKPSQGAKRVSNENFERTHHLRGEAGYRFPWVGKAKQKGG